MFYSSTIIKMLLIINHLYKRFGIGSKVIVGFAAIQIEKRKCISMHTNCILLKIWKAFFESKTALKIKKAADVD
jgi:hypothetical protein